MQVGLVSKYDYMAAEMQIDLELSLSVGDRIHIIGVYTDFIQRVESMKHGGWPVKKGRAAQKVRVPAKYHVRAGDAIELLPPTDGDEDAASGSGLGLWGNRLK